MGKSRKDYEKYLNSISPDRDDEAWIIGGKNRYCGRENYGTMIKRYDPLVLTWDTGSGWNSQSKAEPALA